MLNSEEIKPVAIAIIELRLSEGISQIVSRNSVKTTPSHTLVSGHLPAWKSENSIYEDY